MSSYRLLKAVWLLIPVLLLLAGCTPSEQEQTDVSTESAVESASSAPAYTADTELFDSFEDLKANVELFRQAIPCTRSTKGYHVANDGGAATYRIVNQKPKGVFEKLADGVWAVIEADEFVTPQQFGAFGDGKRNDHTAIMRAVQYASEGGIRLELPEADYYTMNAIILENIEVKSHNAKISYNGIQANTPTLEVRSNTRVTGNLNLYLYDPKTEWSAERCALLIGDYTTVFTVKNCYIESVTLTGGMYGCNGVVIVGDSSEIEIGTVTIPNGTKYARGVCLHWGNGEDHKAVAGFSPELGGDGYMHVNGWDPMTHVHDVKIGKIDCKGLRPGPGMSDSDISPIAICAAYNVTVDEIVVDDSCHAIHITGADLGFEYASEEVKAIGGQKNIRIGKITGTNLRSTGVYIPANPWYYPDISVNTEVTIDEIYLSAAETHVNKNYGVHLDSVGTSSIGKITAIGFKQALCVTEDSVDKVTCGEIKTS